MLQNAPEVAQADALLIEARAKMRLADEYDAAQARGEVAKGGGDRITTVGKHNGAATAADLNIRRDEIHEAHPAPEGGGMARERWDYRWD